jgi:hypothetical protein
VEIELINDVWDEPDWTRHYDLLFISALHSDFDRARQISHYWRVRGAATVMGGPMASTFPELCKPFFDAIAIGDPEGIVPRLFRDVCAGTLQPYYVSGPYDPAHVPAPRLDLVQHVSAVPLALELTRGCPFSCDFCSLTAVGTRYHTRSTATVLRDIEAARRALVQRGLHDKRDLAVFFDNNIGGSFAYLRELVRCARSAQSALGLVDHVQWSVQPGYGETHVRRRLSIPVCRSGKLQRQSARGHEQAAQPSSIGCRKCRSLPAPRHPRRRRFDVVANRRRLCLHRFRP